MEIKKIDKAVVAHAMVEAFRNRTDPHRAVAAAIYGIPAEQVSYEERKRGRELAYIAMYTPTCGVECRT